MIMHTEKKQSYQSFMQEAARKRPDYSIGALAYMWADDIIRDRTSAGSPPRTVETKEIKKECLNRIHAAVESGELEAIYPEKDIDPEIRLSNGSLIRGELKFPSLWIVETAKYIEWARANGVGPSDLVDDVIEDIEPIGVLSESSNKADKKQSTLEREKMLSLILGMAIDAYGYDPQAKRNAATGDNNGGIAHRLPDGLKVDADTIRKYLTEAVSLYPDAKPRKS
jgi:hypothetical protein